MARHDLPDGLHVGGVELIVMLPAKDANRAIARLRSCHDHVFIVDQSMGRDNRVNIGVSARGAVCLSEEFPEIEEIDLD